jgi:hypothetical protein
MSAEAVTVSTKCRNFRQSATAEMASFQAA